jgi:hypothetical protein
MRDAFPPCRRFRHGCEQPFIPQTPGKDYGELLAGAHQPCLRGSDPSMDRREFLFRSTSPLHPRLMHVSASQAEYNTVDHSHANGRRFPQYLCGDNREPIPDPPGKHRPDCCSYESVCIANICFYDLSWWSCLRHDSRDAGESNCSALTPLPLAAIFLIIPLRTFFGPTSIKVSTP